MRSYTKTLLTIRSRFSLEAAGFFLKAALLFGVAFVAVTAPFQAPDEPAHFYRAFAISEGQLTAEVRHGRTGAILPASLGALVDLYTESIVHPPESGIDLGILATSHRVALAPDRRTFLDFPTAAVTTPLTYLPQAAAIAIGRLFGLPPLALLYLARLANLLAATALIYAGLRQLPAYRWLGVAVVLTPMATFLRSSVSADALTFAIAFLFAATVARLAFGEEQTVRWRDVALLCLNASALCLTKAAYVPLVLAAAVIPVRRLTGGEPTEQRPHGRLGAIIFAYAVTTAGAFALSMLTARMIETPPDVVIDAGRQIAGVLQQPLHFLEVTGRGYLSYGPRYAAEFIGRLGWLNIPLPRSLLVTYMGLLLTLLIADTGQGITIAAWQRAVLATATLTNLLLISAVFYAIFMPVGADYIAGIQGRYFLPIFPIAAWTLHRQRSDGAVAAWRLGLTTALFCILALTVSLVVLIRCYDL